jgi:hypothetical protein
MHTAPHTPAHSPAHACTQSCTRLHRVLHAFQFTVVAFTVFALAGLGAFTPQVAFVSLTLVNNLTGPLTVLPHAIANLVMVSQS